MKRHLLVISWCAVSSRAQSEKRSLVMQREENISFVANLSTRYPLFSGEIIGELQVIGSRSIIELEEACRRYPAYTKLVTLVRARAIQAVVCRSRDRLARTDALVMTIERLCEKHGVYIIPRQNPPVTLDPEFLWNAEGSGLYPAIEAHVAASAVRRLTNDHQMGMIARITNGEFAGRIPWGYVARYDVDGKKSIVIDPNAAQAIRLILLNLFVGQQLSLRDIAKQLNDAGIAPPKAEKWASSSIEKIIKNADRYAGYVYVNRNSKRNRPYAEAKSDHPLIIDDVELKTVRKEVERRKR